MDRRALFERSELARPPQARVRPILMRPDGASMVLFTFAKTKVNRLPGRNPATIMNSRKAIWCNVLETMVLFPPNQSEGKGNAYNSYRSRGLRCLLRVRARVYPLLAGRSSWPGLCERPGRLL